MKGFIFGSQDSFAPNCSWRLTRLGLSEDAALKKNRSFVASCNPGPSIQDFDFFPPPHSLSVSAASFCKTLLSSGQAKAGRVGRRPTRISSSTPVGDLRLSDKEGLRVISTRSFPRFRIQNSIFLCVDAAGTFDHSFPNEDSPSLGTCPKKILDYSI